MVLSKEQILAVQPPFEDVDAPELGGAVRVRAMTAGALKRLEAAATDGVEPADMLIASLVDSDGAPLFEHGDRAAVEALPMAVFERLLAAVLRLNQLNRDDAADLAGNGKGGSSSDSASHSGDRTPTRSRKS